MRTKRRVSRLLAAAMSAALALALAIPAGVSATAVPPPPDPNMYGIVTDADTGLPVEGIEVWLEKDAAIAPACFKSTVTDADGIYTFSGMPANYKYWIKVNEQKGYAGYDSELFPFTGAPLNHNFTLAPIPLAVSGVLSRAGEPVKGYKVKLWRVKEGGYEEWVDYLWTEADGAFAFHTEKAGVYFLRVYDPDYNVVYTGDQFEYDGATPLVRDIDLDVDAPERLADETRFSTAVEIAREGFDPAGDASWPGVKAVVIAAGDDRAAADPLSAAGLCGALDAPMFLVSSRFVPSEVKRAVKEIADANGPIKVYIVGGEKSVPNDRFYELKSYVGGDRLSKVRVSGDDRFSTAEKVAYKIKELKGSPSCVLVANGADPSKFFDALSLSPVAAAKGYPILLVSADKVPTATRRALGTIKPSCVIVGGGPKTVSDAVRNAVGGERWSGSTRYSTATAIANKAIGRGWLDNKKVGIASKLPDALTGGSLVGVGGGVLIITDGQELSAATASFLEANDDKITSCYVFGGKKSMSSKVQGQICEKLALDVAGK